MKSFSLIIILIASQGCSLPYYGHTKETWNNLTAIEQEAIKQEYQAVIDSRSDQAHTDKINARTQSIIDRAVRPHKSGIKQLQ